MFKHPVFRIHRRIPELVRVHFSKTFIALNAEALLTEIQDRLHEIRRRSQFLLLSLGFEFKGRPTQADRRRSKLLQPSEIRGADQIMRDINVTGLSAIYTGTLTIEMADTILLPPAHFALLATKRLADNSDVTVLDWIKRYNTYTAVTGRPITVRAVRGLETADSGNARMVDRLRERTRATVVSTAGAMAEALRSAGVSNTAVVTPYLQPINDGLRGYLESSGIHVETLNSFFCKTTAELGQITEDQVLELARRTVTARSKSLFVACSQLPTLNVVAQLRADSPQLSPLAG